MGNEDDHQGGSEQEARRPQRMVPGTQQVLYRCLNPILLSPKYAFASSMETLLMPAQCAFCLPSRYPHTYMLVQFIWSAHRTCFAHWAEKVAGQGLTLQTQPQAQNSQVWGLSRPVKALVVSLEMSLWHGSHLKMINRKKNLLDSSVSIEFCFTIAYTYPVFSKTWQVTCLEAIQQ